MNLFAPNHLILIAIIVLLLFGGKKIPELMRGIGKGMREFTNAKGPKKEEDESDGHDENRSVTTTATRP